MRPDSKSRGRDHRWSGTTWGVRAEVANGITTVHLPHVREKTGHALIGARQ